MGDWSDMMTGDFSNHYDDWYHGRGLKGSVAPRAIQWCSNTTETLCMTEPWTTPKDGYGGNGFVWFLNFILAFVFPLIPWDVFFFIPWVIAWAANRHIKDPSVTKGKISHLIIFVNFYGGVYGGLAHPLGLIQAFASLAGGDGICVVHPPPGPIGAIGPPFKLYYGFKKYGWCYLLALHVISVSMVGWVFLYIIIKERAAVIAAGKKPWFKIIAFIDDWTPNVLYGRCALWFFVGGISQAAPYFAVYGKSYFGDILVSTGGYSKRPFSPGLTENFAAWSWMAGGVYFMAMYFMTAGETSAVVKQSDMA